MEEKKGYEELFFSEQFFLSGMAVPRISAVCASAGVFTNRGQIFFFRRFFPDPFYLSQQTAAELLCIRDLFLVIFIVNDPVGRASAGVLFDQQAVSGKLHNMGRINAAFPDGALMLCGNDFPMDVPDFIRLPDDAVFLTVKRDGFYFGIGNQVLVQQLILTGFHKKAQNKTQDQFQNQ